MSLRTILLALPLGACALLVPGQIVLGQDQGATLRQFNTVRERLLQDMQRAGESMAGEALAQYIWASKADAVKAGVRPMPAEMRARLKGHFPDALLDRVRYRIGVGNEYGLPARAFRTNAIAITLGDVILFRPAQAQITDLRLWAHELSHVQQYDRWGVRGFARRYTLDHGSVEREAEANAQRIVAAGKRGA